MEILDANTDWIQTVATQIWIFFMNLITLRAFVLWTEEFQFNMANIGTPSFPYSFQDSEIANTGESTLENNGRNGDVSVGFLPFCFSHSFSCLMQLIPYFLCPVHFILVWILLIVFEFWKARERSKELFGGREGRRAGENDGGVEYVWRWSLNCNSSCWNCSCRGKMHWKCCQEEGLYMYF